MVQTCEPTTYDALVRRCDYKIEAYDKKGRGIPRETWKTLIKNMEYLELMEDVTQN